MYALGVDLGTTFTAASTWRSGHAEIASLGSRAAAVPSVVLLREDETFLTGESANRRGLSEPHRVAREFKRRFGDTTPILLGGVPYSAEALMARLLRWVVDEVARREGGLPAGVTVSHPANWGPYKTDLLRQAVRLSGLEVPVSFTTEPEAAAVFYAQQQRIDPGSVVAVYDLGGGTFDAAVLRKTATGFEILGQPEGIERLGGIDFDAAVFNHVAQALGGKLSELDEDDPATIAAVGRLREECVEAKEALSADTDASIPVLLPNVTTEVRLTRGEYEAMVRPALYGSIEALKRAIRSAGVTPEELHSVLLVGGSSRMPIVAQLVGAELGRPVAVDAHPKHAVALGAAWLAAVPLGSASVPAPGTPGARGVATVTILQPPARTSAAPTPTPTSAPPTPPTTPTAPAAKPAPPANPAPPARKPAAAAGGAAVGGAAAGALYGSTGGYAAVQPTRPTSGPPAHPTSGPPAYPTSGPPAFSSSGPPAQQHWGGPPAPTSPPHGGGYPPQGLYGGPPQFPTGPTAPEKDDQPRRGRTAVIVGACLLLLAIVGGVAYATNNLGLGGEDPSGAATPDPVVTTGAPPTQAAEVPADEQCTPEIQANERWVCLTSARIVGDAIIIEYEASWADATPNINGGFHLHIYGGDGKTPPARIMGAQAANPGVWYVEDKEPSTRATSGDNYRKAIGDDAEKVCARIAEAGHHLVKDNDGGFKTGNCVPIQR
jgi:molecular chaperone DnaK